MTLPPNLSSAVKLSSLSNLKVNKEIHKEQIQEAFEDVTQIPNDIIVVSEENEEIQTSKYLLSLLSPTLRSLIKEDCCIKQKILLPDCSAKSINHLLNIACTGVTYNEAFSNDDIKEIIDTAELLSIDIKANHINFDNTNLKLKIELEDNFKYAFDDVQSDNEIKSEFEKLGTPNVSKVLNENSVRKVNAVLRVKEKMGEERANIVTSAWNKVRHTAKSDDFLLNLMSDHNLSQGEVKYFFGVGSSRFNRLKSSAGPNSSIDDILIGIDNYYAKEEEMLTSTGKEDIKLASKNETEEISLSKKKNLFESKNDDKINPDNFEIDPSFENYDEIMSESLGDAAPNFPKQNKLKNNAILRVKEKFGEEKASIVASAWNKVRETSKSDDFLLCLMIEYNLSQLEVKYFFGIGSSRFCRLKGLEGPNSTFDDILTGINNEEKFVENSLPSTNEEQKLLKQLHREKRRFKVISKVKNKLGGEKEANSVLATWKKVRDTSKSDVFLQSMIHQHNLSQVEARSFFGVGTNKFNRLRRADIASFEEKEKVETLEKDGETFYICNQCEFKSLRKDVLKEHKEGNHENILYFCEQCDYTSKKKRCLKQHIISVHEGPFIPCEQCGKQFSKKALKQHHSTAFSLLSFCNTTNFPK